MEEQNGTIKQSTGIAVSVLIPLLLGILWIQGEISNLHADIRVVQVQMDQILDPIALQARLFSLEARLESLEEKLED